jgi:D-alanine-D-alanine ligase
MAMVTKKKIGVLMGGLSSEREVSLASGNAVLKALQEKGYDAVGIDVGRDAAERIRKTGVELVFNGLHGKFSGTVRSGLLGSWAFRIPAPHPRERHGRTRSSQDGVQGARPAGRPVYDRRSGKARDVEQAPSIVAYPVVVKPCAEGSNVGVSLVYNMKISSAAELAFDTTARS